MGVPAAVSLYVIVHVCDASVHGFEVVNDPVPDVVVNVTVPVGLLPLISIAVHVVVSPTVNDGHETPTAGAIIKVTVTFVVP